jgi:hypothetical protein
MAVSDVSLNATFREQSDGFAGRATDFYGGPRLTRHEFREISQVLLGSPTCCCLALVAPVHVLAGVVMLALLLQVGKPAVPAV